MDFRRSVGIKNPCFFGGFPCLFPKKNKEKKDRVVTKTQPDPRVAPGLQPGRHGRSQVSRSGPKSFREGAQGLCGRRNKRLIALAKHGRRCA